MAFREPRPPFPEPSSILASAPCGVLGVHPHHLHSPPTPMTHIMDTFDYDKEFSEWVYIREQAETALVSSPPTAVSYLTPSSPPFSAGTAKDLSLAPNVNGDIIFSLPEHIILNVFHYSSTDPYAAFRYVFSVFNAPLGVPKADRHRYIRR